MRVYFDTIGCRLNQAEIESLAGQFSSAGHLIVESADQADLVIVNTCAVTAEATSDSRGKVRAAARQGAARIIVTGCWATVEPQAAALLPGVSQVVQNADKDAIASEELCIPLDQLLVQAEREAIPGKRHRTRAFIKVQDGCDNHCTYCVTRIARGESRSTSVERVVKDIQRAVASGCQEAVLSGVHLGAWGKDFAHPASLRELIAAILDKTSVKRLRLSSIEPWDIPDTFFDLWQDERLMQHFHLPLQSGSASVLRRMGRNTTPEGFSRLVDTIRHTMPDAAITTDVIVGFPGESDAEFDESLNFIQSMAFAAGHVFRFSPRPGTAAARLPQPVPGLLSKQRSAMVRDVLEISRTAYLKSWVGRSEQVLWEQQKPLPDGGFLVTGLTGHYITVQAVTRTDLTNHVSTVQLEAVTIDGLIGRIIEN